MDDRRIFLLIVMFAIIVIIGMIITVFRAAQNNVECWQLISTRSRMGEERADPDKIMKLIAMVVFTGVTIYYVYSSPLGGDVLLLITAYVGFATGVPAFNASLRSRQDAPKP